ncbi:MAG: peptidoglycan editing factor PgeF [Clostridium sp.]|nr:peptidoglycan editing factor PgeF [Clostridium sp.]
MISLTAKDFHKKKDFLVYKLEEINLVFSTAINERSFNRHIESGVRNLNTIIEDFDLNRLEYIKQVHSDKVYIYTEKYKNFKENEGDALITKEVNTGIGVFTADCVPILIVDIKNNVIAAIHSGWKGTFKSIVLRTLEKMVQEYKIDINNTKVFIGPHIRQCCYEVSEELRDLFIEKTKINKDILFKGRNLSMEECILKDIREFGISENNIYSLKLCTHCTKDIKLFSYRKSSGTYGRLFSFVFIK